MFARHFASHGFKKVLYLGGPADNVDSNDRYFGFRIGFEESGLDPGSDPFGQTGIIRPAADTTR